MASLLLLQVFCVPVLAAGEPEITIAYDGAAGTVNVKAFGFGAYSMISLSGYYDDSLDFLNQYAAGAAGNLDVTYLSSAKWAKGGVIKVIAGAGELSEPIVRTVTISDKPYIKDYTNSLTRECAANILVVIGNPAVGLSAEVAVGGNTYKTSFNGGESAMIKVTEAINETDLILRLTNGDELLDSKPIEMKDMPENLWEPTAELSGNDLRIIFAAAVMAGPNGYAAAVNGVASVPIPDGDKILKFENATLLDENTVVISGVKFPDYFPSYSFTFSFNF